MFFKTSCTQESCITPLLEEVAREAPLYFVKMRCLRVRELRMVANSVYMKISDCLSRGSVALRSEHRYVDSGTLGSIPGWKSQIFRIYKYDRIKSTLHIYIYNLNIFSFRSRQHLFNISVVHENLGQLLNKIFKPVSPCFTFILSWKE